MTRELRRFPKVGSVSTIKKPRTTRPHSALAEQGRRLQARSRGARLTRSTILAAFPEIFLVLMFGCFFASGVPAGAQSSQPAAQSTSQSADAVNISEPATPESGADLAADRNVPAAANDALQRTALTYGQIAAILDESPDLVVEIKSLAADRMREQGAEIDATDISDDALYSQLAAERRPSRGDHCVPARARIADQRRPANFWRRRRHPQRQDERSPLAPLSAGAIRHRSRPCLAERAQAATMQTPWQHLRRGPRTSSKKRPREKKRSTRPPMCPASFIAPLPMTRPRCTISTRRFPSPRLISRDSAPTFS